MRWVAPLALAAGCLSSPPSGGKPDAGPGDTAWQVALGQSSPYLAAADGNAVVVAGFEGTVALERPITAPAGGGSDLLVAGFDRSGGLRFAEAYGGPAVEVPSAVALSRVTGEVSVVGVYGGGEANAGGDALPAGTGYSMFAARYGAAGAHRWSLHGAAAAGSVLPPSSLSIGGSGDIALGGTYVSMFQLGGLSAPEYALSDVYLARIASNGVPQVLFGYGTDGDQFGAGALHDGLGSVYLFGTAADPFTIDTVSPDAGAMFVVRIDDISGEVRWMVDTVGGMVNDLRGAVLPDGCLLLAGRFEGSFAFDVPDSLPLESRGGTDAFIAVIEPDGEVAWLEQLGGQGDDLPLGVAAAPDGRFAVSGEFRGTARLGDSELSSDGNGDAFVIAFEADRTVRWARRFGGPENDKGLSVAMDDDGGVLLGAVYRGEVDFGGPAPLSSGGGDGGALIRLR